MKLNLLFTAMLVTTFCSAQMQRAFYKTDNTNSQRTEILAEIAGQLVFASIKEQSEDSITIVTGYLDENGETSNYRSTTLEGIITGTSFALSGYAVNSNGELILAIQAYIDGATGSTLNYVQVDPVEHLVVPINTNVVSMKGAFVRSRQNDDVLVTYYADDANEFKRIETSINLITNQSTTLIDPSLNYSGTLMNKRVEFLVDDNGSEFVSVNTKLFKRTPANTITSTDLIGFSNINGVTMAINSDGNDDVFVLHGNAYRQISSNLDSITSGTITGLVNGQSRNTEMYYENGKYMLLGLTATNNYNPFIIDASNYTIESSMINSSSYHVPNNLLVTSTGHYFIGIKSALEGFSTFVSKLELNATTEPFIEYGQHFYSANQKVNTTHLGKFFNEENATAGFLTTHEGQYKGLIFSASNSIVGQDANLNLTGFTNNYYTNGMHAGPFVEESHRTNELIDKYNRGYAVDKDMIDNHIINISNGNPSYEMPFGIREWPGNGNTAIGQAATILPFKDQNINGIYEPELGDYPQIFGDKCVVNVFHQGEDVDGSGIECHQYFYSFDCDSSELMRNTIFVNQRFFARNGVMNDTYVGSFMDTDIGGPQDDYSGSNVELGMTYAHNGDYYDLTESGVIGFNEAVPALGMQILRGPKLADDSQDNNIGIGVNESANGFGFADAIIDNEYLTLESSRIVTNSVAFPNTDPTGLSQAYQVYQGKLADGSANYVGMSAVETTFDYFGDSDPLLYATNGIDPAFTTTEVSEMNTSGDRRVYGGTGPFDFTNAIDTFELVTAYIVAHDTVSVTPANFGLDLLFERGTQLKSQYAQNNAGCGSSFGYYVSPLNVGLEELEISASIYPNPTQSLIKIITDQSVMESIQLYSLDGMLVVDQEVGGNSVIVDLNTLRSGIYIVKIHTTNGTVTKKVSKL